MPLKIISTPDDPNNARRAVYFSDACNARQRPPGNYTFDASGKQYRRADTLSHDAPLAREFMIGLDLAQSNDFTALAVVERVQNGYAVPMLTRTRGLDYPSIVARVGQLLKTPPLAGQAELVIDGTGVGRPVLNLFQASEIEARSITITAGQRPSGTLRHAKVPKRDLVNAVLLAFQAGTIQIAANAEHARTLLHELAEMRVKLTASGMDRYEARAGEHDDLVIALALAVWSLEKTPSRLHSISA